VPVSQVRRVLDDAGVDAEVADVPATLEEAMTSLDRAVQATTGP